MAGYQDEEAFDRELVSRMPLGGLVGDITCSVLFGIGEFAEAGRDVRHYVHRNGGTTDGAADPQWWSGAVPSALDQLRTSPR